MPNVPATRHHRLRWTIMSIVGILVIVSLATGWLIYRAIAVVNTKKLDGSNTRLSFFQQLTHLVAAHDEQLQGETEDRINVLLLGYGGPGHDGPYLTDTMMVISYKPSTNQLSLLSIPRDLVVNIPGYDYRKINNVLSFGRDQQYPGGGEALTVKVVSDLLNVPIQYYAEVDFKGFQEVVDRLGGVAVNVQTAFADYSYPTNNFGYQTVRFKAGPQVMNGDIALKYARSRHGTNGEGSDFARARRQQQILFGTKEKLLSFGTLTNPKKISDILGSLGTHSQTNMEVWEMVRLGKLAGHVNHDQVINKVLDDSTNGFLQDETGLGGAFILVPRDRTYHDIAFLAQNIFLIGQAMKENATIAVVNATKLTGLGETFSRNLASFELTMAKPTTLNHTTVGTTVMINLGPRKFSATADLVGSYVRARGIITLDQWEAQTSDLTLREYVSSVQSAADAAHSVNPANTNRPPLRVPNFLLILGQDQPKNSGLGLIPYFKPRVSASVVTKTTNTNTPTKKL